MNKVFISTGAFKTKKLSEILELASKNNYKNIELSSGLIYCQNVEELLSKYTNINYLIHNYFPTPKRSFVLNLASSDKEIIRNSMNLCKKAIDMSSNLGCEYYSVHCGFYFDCLENQLGDKSQLNLKRATTEEAYNIFIDNIKILTEYAKNKKVKLAIENNVSAGFCKLEDAFQMYIGIDNKTIKKIINDVNHDNLFILLDLGHSKVNENSVGMDTDKLIEDLYDKIIGVHISDNDGINDLNLKLDYGSTLLKYVRKLKDKYFVIECYNLDIYQINDQINILGDVIND